MIGVAREASSPLISAVVCTYNRAPLLARALGALCGQTMSPEHFEIVVVDDGSTDDTRETVNSFRSSLPIRYAYQANSGLASGKNHGLFLSRGAIVLFLEDDGVADSRLLEEHYRSHQKFVGEQYAVLGYTDLASAVARSPLMHYVTQVGCHLFSYPLLNHEDILDFSYFSGSRSSCKRMFLLENGVFNPLFRFGADDVELGYRLSKLGLRVVYNSSAVSHMIRTLDFETFCRRCYRQGRSNWMIGKLHPNEVIRTWLQVDGASEEWAKLQPAYDKLMKMSRDLDVLVTERIRADRPLGELDRELLYRAYGAAFYANRIKGTAQIELEAQQVQCNGPTTSTLPDAVRA
jgi:glycosyltransferase involved in cell wall biosynthesis